MSLLGKKSDLNMSKMIVILLDSKSLRQREEDVSRSSSMFVTASDWQRWKRSGSDTYHKCDNPGHFRRDCPERQLDSPPTPASGHTMVALGDDSDVIVCISEEDAYESVSDGTCNGSDGTDSS
jgi:Zinc knuckle